MTLKKYREVVEDEELIDAVTDVMMEQGDDVDWSSLSPQQYKAQLRLFLRRLAGAEGLRNKNKPFLPDKKVVSPAAKTYPNRKEDDDKEHPENKLRPPRVPVVAAEEKDESHKQHGLYPLLRSHGYEHHTTHHIKQPDASVKKYFIFANRHSNLVGTYQSDHRWTSKINKNSGHSVSSTARNLEGSKAELDKHLAARTARNKKLPEQRSLPSNPLQEGLQNPYGADKVRRYSEWMREHPIRSLDHEIGCETNEGNTRDGLITAWRMKAEHDKDFGFDEENKSGSGWTHLKSHSSYIDKKDKK